MNIEIPDDLPFAAAGGDADPVAEEFLAEVLAERASGVATDAASERNQ